MVLPDGLGQTIPFTFAGVAPDTVTYSGQYLILKSVGATTPAIKSMTVIPANIPARAMSVIATVRAADGTRPFLPLFMEAQKGDANNFIGFLWNGVATLTLRCRRNGTATDSTISKTPSFFETDHEYRIDYLRNQVTFYIDGVSQNNLITNIPAPPFVCEAIEPNPGPATLYLKFPFVIIGAGGSGALVGSGMVQLYGLDNRSGLTSADGAPIVLFHINMEGDHVYRITADIFATAVAAGTANYTITWTENATTQTMVVSASVLNTIATATDLINPDASTDITAQLTFVGFTGTVKVAAVVEELA